MAPTGAGKTYLGMRIAYEAMQRGKRAIFLCDRTVLIDQTSETADSFGLPHGVIQANHWRRHPHELMQVASVQTIAKRGYWPEADVVIVDEAHTTYKAWTDYAQNSKSAIIGLSATPFTKGLGKIFSNLINATTMHELTQSGVLVPLRIFSCRRPDMTGAETRGGEWTDEAAAEREMAIVGDVVQEWHKFADNRKTIVFGATIKHCEELCRQFNDSGVLAALYTSHTSKKERDELLEEYRKEDSLLRILISVEALAKGFDVRDVGCICDARPLRKSLSTAIQMWGRGMRCSEETNKENCYLLDFSGNIIRFFEDFNDIYFNGLDKLDDGEKLDKKIREKEEWEPKSCPKCQYTPFLKRCMMCGHETQSKSLVEAHPGVMEEVRFSLDGKKKKLASDGRNLWAQLCGYARIHSKPEKQAGRAYNLYKAITGFSPPWNFHMTESKNYSKNTLIVIRKLADEYRKSQRKKEKANEHGIN
jgi:superfamily II DNA or RNA helicase